MTTEDYQARGMYELTAARLETTAREGVGAAAEFLDSPGALPSSVDLRNATQLTHAPVDNVADAFDLGLTIAAFAEVVAVMRVADGSLVDDEVLHAVISRLADLLGEPVPADL